MIDQADRDFLRKTREIVLNYESDEEIVDSIEAAQAYAKENGTPDCFSLFRSDGGFLYTMNGNIFMSIDVADLDEDNFIEKSRKVDRIVVSYGDYSKDHYKTFEGAKLGIAETLNGCDLAINVEYIKGWKGDEHVCNYSVETVVELKVQPAV